MLKNFFILCLLLGSVSFSVHATSPNEILENFISNTKSLSADFEQQLVDQSGAIMQQSKGRLSMMRPGKFRWDYSEPYPQNIISNGMKIWMYDSELEQVSIRRYDQVLASSPVNLLDRNQKLDIEFNVEIMPAREGQDWVKLTPKKDGGDFKELIIGLQNNQIKTMRFFDNFEQRTEIKFDHLVINPKFEAAYFEFKAPEGTDVVGDF
ncbi:hypothetical protein MNBD_GAMMA07-1148 [hydrothermal vent metagenome]|uniref:Outer-membrane lipoprotein carrier protein n=1 Tax=hydrothermal vent metagenome TaxID=652676 RepID=A0A3B0WNI0_9ZZZZ